MYEPLHGFASVCASMTKIEKSVKLWEKMGTPFRFTVLGKELAVGASDGSQLQQVDEGPVQAGGCYASAISSLKRAFIFKPRGTGSAFFSIQTDT